MISIERGLLTRILIYAIAGGFILGSLLFSNYLANRLEENVNRDVRLYATALELLSSLNIQTNSEMAYALYIQDSVMKKQLVPIILENSDGSMIDAGDSTYFNLDDDPVRRKEELAEIAKKFSKINPPIIIEESGQKVYYGNPSLMHQLRWFPIAQLLTAFIFLGVVLYGFALAKRSEQNRVWVGLAKETAHQLGTPVSSLMGWIELLRIKPMDDMTKEAVDEMERDVLRLENISERFSKIGSEPELYEHSPKEILDRSANYLTKRMTKSGKIQLEVKNNISTQSSLKINPQLFDWVIENLLKNALDAIQSERKSGKITLEAGEKGANYFIDVSDTGKGIPKSNFKTVFEPGFTTKKRGWGLGLSLTKRIIENYHKGKIFVKSSEVGEGTTFRIILPKK